MRRGYLNSPEGRLFGQKYFKLPKWRVYTWGSTVSQPNRRAGFAQERVTEISTSAAILSGFSPHFFFYQHCPKQWLPPFSAVRSGSSVVHFPLSVHERRESENKILVNILSNVLKNRVLREKTYNRFQSSIEDFMIFFVSTFIDESRIFTPDPSIIELNLNRSAVNFRNCFATRDEKLSKTLNFLFLKKHI